MTSEISKMSGFTWTVKYLNEFNEPYYSTSDHDKCRHLDINEWETCSKEKALSIARDLLDVPEAELTFDAVKRDFDGMDVSEKKLLQIQDYYNGRYALFNTMKSDLSSFDADACTTLHTFHYDIPEKYNTFNMMPENDGDYKQISGYIEMTFKRS